MNHNPVIEKRHRFVKTSKWVLGIILSGILTIGSGGFIMHYSGTIDKTIVSGLQYWLFFFAVPIAAFASFVFLSCLFVPLKKMYAGIVVTLLSLLFIAYGAYEHYNYDGFVDGKHLTIYTGFITGMIAGFILSYNIFKNRNWG